MSPGSLRAANGAALLCSTAAFPPTGRLLAALVTPCFRFRKEEKGGLDSAYSRLFSFGVSLSGCPSSYYPTVFA